MNKGKLIDADKLKKAINGFGNLIPKFVLDLIDELSEDREDVVRIKGSEFCNEEPNEYMKFTDWAVIEGYTTKVPNSIMNLFIHYLESINKHKKEQPNPLKVAIKGDGTEEYGKKIIEYFENLETYTSYISCDVAGFYYYSENGEFKTSETLPEGYIEISLKEEQLIEQVIEKCDISHSVVMENVEQQLDDKATIEQLRREKEVLLERLEQFNSSIATSKVIRITIKELYETTLNQNVQLKEDNKTLNKELEEVMSDRDDLAKKFIEFKDRENVILEASIKEVENRKKVLINKILDFNNQYKNSISTIQDFKNGVHKTCTQIIDLVEKM